MLRMLFLMIVVSFISHQAFAADGDDVALIQKMIAKQESGCRFKIEWTGPLSNNYLSDYYESVSLWFVSREGCSGGNNWGMDILPFYTKSAKVKTTVKSIPLSNELMNVLLVPKVENVTFRSTKRTSKEGASLSEVELDALDYDSEDARCCPSAGKRIKIWIEEGRIRASVIKTWKERQ